jgi:hypothetical protein
LTLRLRLALLWGGLTGLVVLIVGVFAYAGEVTGVHNRLDGDLKRAVEHVAERMAERAPGGVIGRADSATPLSAPEVLLAQPHLPGITLRVHDAGGALIAEQPRGGPAPAADPRAVMAAPSSPAYDLVVERLPPYITVDPGRGAFAVETDEHGHRWRFYVLRTEEPEAPSAPATYVVGAAPLVDVDNAVATLRRLVPLLSATGALAIFGAGAWLAARLLQPVAQLTDTASEIARARAFGQRVAVG